MSSVGKVGYVLKRYPRLSETFVVSEILAREAAGEDVAVAALGPAGDPHFHPAVAQVRAPITWVPDPSRVPADLWSLLAAADVAHPGLPDAWPELLGAPARTAAQALHVADWVHRHGITHLHAHFATLAATVARLASRVTGVPYSFTAHAKDIFHRDVDPEALATLLGDAHHVVAVSDVTAAWLRERFGGAAARVHRVHNGIDPAAIPFSEPARRSGRVAYVGRLVEKKGVADLLDALAVLRDRGRPTGLDVVGGGVLEPVLRAQVDALGLSGDVTFHGPLPGHRVAAVMSAASVLVAPCVHAADGDRDGLPTVLLEAMALGTPCVSTPVSGIPEAVLDGRTGTLVPERDPHAVADAVAALLDDAALRVRLARAARAHVETTFDRARQAATMAALRRDPTDLPDPDLPDPDLPDPDLPDPDLPDPDLPGPGPRDPSDPLPTPRSAPAVTA